MAYPVRFYRVSPSCKKRGQNLTPSYFTGSPRPRLILQCHKYKKVKDLSIGYPDLPDWFIKGVEAVAMAPSALNQHSYRFGIRDEKVYVKKGLGIALDTDIGIAKYHFEVAAGKDSSIWE